MQQVIIQKTLKYLNCILNLCDWTIITKILLRYNIFQNHAQYYDSTFVLSLYFKCVINLNKI